MRDPRVVVEPAELLAILAGERLPESVVHYFTQVLRLSPGQKVEVADGQGGCIEGRLAKRAAIWSLGEGERVESPSRAQSPSLTVFAAVLKPKRWSLLLEKAAEMGVCRLVPVITERTVVRLSDCQNERTRARWQKIVNEAGKQCRRPWLTRVEPASPLARALELDTAESRLLAHPSGRAAGWWEALDKSESLSLLIGPEGGLNEVELALLEDSGRHFVSLGAYPLRAETAMIVLLSMLRDRMGVVEAERER